MNQDRIKANFHNIMGWNPYPADDTPCQCIQCEWEGTIAETKRHGVNSPRDTWQALAGREGYEWDCPQCGAIVYAHYTKVS